MSQPGDRGPTESHCPQLPSVSVFPDWRPHYGSERGREQALPRGCFPEPLHEEATQAFSGPSVLSTRAAVEPRLKLTPLEAALGSDLSTPFGSLTPETEGERHPVRCRLVRDHGLTLV